MTTADVFQDRLAEFRSLGARLGCGGGLCRAPILTRPTRSSPDTWAAGSKIRRSFADTLSGIHFYDGEQETGSISAPRINPGQIYETMQHVIDVWSSLGASKLTSRPLT